MSQAEKKKNNPVSLDGDDWEAVALRRVALHVEALPDTPPEADDFGWEEGVLERLRKRLGTVD